MKYTILSHYELNHLYDSLEECRDALKKDTTSRSSDQYIVQVLEGYQVQVPYTLKEFDQATLGSLLLSHDQLRLH